MFTLLNQGSSSQINLVKLFATVICIAKVLSRFGLKSYPGNTVIPMKYAINSIIIIYNCFTIHTLESHSKYIGIQRRRMQGIGYMIRNSKWNTVLCSCTRIEYCSVYTCRRRSVLHTTLVCAHLREQNKGFVQCTFQIFKILLLHQMFKNVISAELVCFKFL